jgi:hypothetical protein
MNKQAKKKLELQLSTAIEGILVKQDTGAAAKSKKSVKQASKAVVKKFNKALKALQEKKEAARKKIKSKKKKTTKKSSLKNITGENAKIKRSYTKESPTLPVETPENFSVETTRTENL